MPTLTKTQLDKRPKDLYQPLFYQEQTKPKTHPRQNKTKKPQQIFEASQTKDSQPLLVDLLNMYPPRSDPLDTRQDNMSNMKFPLNTSPTHIIVQWSPYFEPIFVPIPPRC